MYCDGFRNVGNTVIELEPKNNGVIVKHGDFVPEKIDIVWCPYEPLIPIGIQIKHKFDIPVVGHFEIVPPDIDVKFDLYMHLCNEIKNVDAITYASVYHKHKIEKIYKTQLPTGKIKPYPVDFEYMNKIKFSGHEKKQILVIGRLVKHKHVDDVIYAISRIKNVELKIIGSGPCNVSLNRLVDKLNIRDRVTFLGMVNDSIKYDEIQKSLFGISLWAWLPVSEFAFFKKPVISYDRIDTKERLGKIPIYSEENNINKLVFNMINLLNNETKRKECGKNANWLLLNKKTFSWNKNDCAQYMIKIFNDVIKREKV